MKYHHISPLIRVVIIAVSLFAIWIGINEYVDVKNETLDRCLAIMRMLFMMMIVFGSSYTIYVILSYSYKFYKTRLLRTGNIESECGFSQKKYEDMVNWECLQQSKYQIDLLESINTYSSLTFGKLINSEHLNILIENIKLLSVDKDSTGYIMTRLTGVTSNDLYHFGWNVGKRLKKTNTQIAWFLKDTFKAMLEDVSIETIQTKLAIKEGNFTLKLIPVNEPLIPHIFPESVQVASY